MSNYLSETAAQHYWDQMLQGDGERCYMDDGSLHPMCMDMFQVDSVEEAQWLGELKIGDWVAVWKDTQGFLIGYRYDTRAELKAAFEKYLG